ncbi:NADPH-dependent assimilatory sulfite reductase hemoprotein subunit [Mucilaginibacter ginsenosidivorans]|uniref:Sulfite reductase [NADPH] hemoprotein beta-component n=1 Tax=Mucilaginibacter ginsenosidivorans TaxID=398053 RepID=A0A5B8UTU8_9SPHI|nr:NADPH-dependent assimilatory sulfite reductase hemoprotein subunit [Mucilaginibacter ginsenosidivorans]QEC62349.1 NADPH-dependent assimilatory sulfite reductase hemoprotein subunit [Mucilaginibacter ginsenosidivorans]
MTSNATGAEVSQEEHIKEDSNFLRGTIVAGLDNPLTGSLTADDAKMVKFHGSYQQHDRDLEKERKKQKLEPLYQFMLRVRAAGGITTPAQWLVLDELAEKYGNGTMKLTTRQSFQFHGIMKRNLKATIKAINDTLMTTIATCGDVNRNVMCNPNPYESRVHGEVYAWAGRLSDYFQPKTKAYFEIWLDQEKVAGAADIEPLYHATYLPRKFKIAFAIPPHNDIDLFANDLGFIVIEEKGKLKGFNVCVGGGMGMTFGDEQTYPRLADVIGFIRPDEIVEVAETIIGIQRDHGNRLNRKNARLKYTIDAQGLPWFIAELARRRNKPLLPALPYHFKTNGDQYGWLKGTNGKWFYTLFVEHGRVKDREGYPLKKAIRAVAALNKGDLRLTGNQNLIIGNISPEDKGDIEKILNDHDVFNNPQNTALRLNSMACVALNTCGLAFAESERYLPSLIDKLDVILRDNGLEKEAINIRMTGCPNGCDRSSLGEIGFIGRAIGQYNLYLGASHNGDRLNTLYKEMLSEAEILQALEPILISYAAEKLAGEHFGDYVHRKNIVQDKRKTGLKQLS